MLNWLRASKMAEKTTAVIKNLKPGNFVIIDDHPCKVEKVSTTTSGKHGAAKTRIEAVDIFDRTKRSIVKPADATVEVPIIVKKKAQVLAVTGNTAHLMDLENYSELELEIPEERKEEIVVGAEVEYYEVLDVKTLEKIK